MIAMLNSRLGTLDLAFCSLGRGQCPVRKYFFIDSGNVLNWIANAAMAIGRWALKLYTFAQ